MNRYSKKVKAKNKYKEFLRVLNGNLHLTDRELEILSLLLEVDMEWKSLLGSTYKNINSTDSRKLIMKESRITKTNLTRFISKFKEKGLVIINSEGGLEMEPIFKPKEAGKIIEVVFALDFGNN